MKNYPLKHQQKNPYDRNWGTILADFARNCTSTSFTHFSEFSVIVQKHLPPKTLLLSQTYFCRLIIPKRSSEPFIIQNTYTTTTYYLKHIRIKCFQSRYNCQHGYLLCYKNEAYNRILGGKFFTNYIACKILFFGRRV